MYSPSPFSTLCLCFPLSDAMRCSYDSFCMSIFCSICYFSIYVLPLSLRLFVYLNFLYIRGIGVYLPPRSLPSPGSLPSLGFRSPPVQTTQSSSENLSPVSPVTQLRLTQFPSLIRVKYTDCLSSFRFEPSVYLVPRPVLHRLPSLDTPQNRLDVLFLTTHHPSRSASDCRSY